MRRLFDVADDPLITNQWRCSVVGHLENDVNLPSRFVGSDEAGLVFGVASAEGYSRRSRICLGILLPSERQFVVVGIDRYSGQFHRFARLHFARQCADQFDDGSMIGFLETLHTPVGSCRKVVLQRTDPAPLRLEVGNQGCIVRNLFLQSLAAPGGIRKPAPRGILVAGLCHRIEPRVFPDLDKTPAPAAPGRLFIAAQAIRDAVEECRRITLGSEIAFAEPLVALRMSLVQGAQRAVVLQNVGLHP